MLDSKTAIELGETLGQITPCENSSELVGVISYVFMWRSMSQSLSVEVKGLH